MRMRRDSEPTLRWRYYRIAAGNAPVRDFMRTLPLDHQRSIRTAQSAAELAGTRAGRHLRGDLYELRAMAVGAHYRLVFSLEGRRILLAIDIFDKNDNRTRETVIKRSLARLADWRERGRG